MATKKTSKKSKKKVSFDELTKEELIKTYQDIKKEMQEVRFKIVTAAYSDVKKIKNLKKQVARIKTVLRQREIQNQK